MDTGVPLWGTVTIATLTLLGGLYTGAHFLGKSGLKPIQAELRQTTSGEDYALVTDSKGSEYPLMRMQGVNGVVDYRSPTEVFIDSKEWERTLVRQAVNIYLDQELNMHTIYRDNVAAIDSTKARVEREIKQDLGSRITE